MPKTTKATKIITVIEAYSESKMVFFKNIERRLKAVNYLRKKLNLRCLTDGF